MRLPAALAIVVAAWSLAGEAAQLKPPLSPLPQFKQTQEWFRLAKIHTPGRIDEALRTVAGWKAAQVFEVETDVGLLHALLVAAMTKHVEGAHVTVGRVLWLKDLPALLDVPTDYIYDPSRPIDPVYIADPNGKPRAEIAKILLQAVLMETDLIMAALDQASGIELAKVPSVTTYIADAQRTSAANLEPFWDTARHAMDLVEPTPRGRTVARQWYDVTGEYLIAHRDYATGVPHLEHARDVLPNDATLALQLGIAFENMAASQIQSGLREGEAPLTIGSRPALLAKAEFQFRSALLLDPDFAEARLHLGHTLGLMNRPAESLALLNGLDVTLKRPDLRYLAALFTGRAQEMLGRAEEARTSFERASQLFPASQSPRLALARLGFDGGRQAEAASAVRGLRPNAALSAAPADPWWVYDVSSTVGVSERMDSMRAAAAVAVAEVVR